MTSYIISVQKANLDVTVKKISRFSCIWCHGVTSTNQQNDITPCKNLSTSSWGKFLLSSGLCSQLKKCGDMYKRNQWQCKSNCGIGSGSEIHWGRIPLP